MSKLYPNPVVWQLDFDEVEKYVNALFSWQETDYEGLDQ